MRVHSKRKTGALKLGKKTPKPTPADATWFDHQQLLFWLRACMRDAEVYLASSRASKEALDEISAAFDDMNSGGFELIEQLGEKYRNRVEEQRLYAYHFIVVTGNTLRLLRRALHLFPAIQPSFNRAEHLFSEAKELRDMVEHSHGEDGYIAGGGKYPDRFVRDDSPKPGVSGDANSEFIDESGHWLGGRLCVEKVQKAVSEIYENAKEIPAPIQGDE